MSILFHFAAIFLFLVAAIFGHLGPLDRIELVAAGLAAFAAAHLPLGDWVSRG